MARKSKGATVNSPMPSLGNRMNTEISEAENGFVVNVSGETGGKKPNYFHKRFIATTRPEALSIAASHFTGAGKSKGAKKKGRKASPSKGLTS